MLPKLTALRQRGSVIRFAIATNYAERIDPAIARKGRIDESFVIAPPNLNARRLVLEDMPPLAAERLAAVTPLWVYGDLKTLSPDDDPEQIMLQSPSGSLASYKSRQSTPRKEILANEILQLAPLYLDGRGPEVLNARGKDEIGAIVWAKDNASLDRREAAAAIIKRLEEQGVLGPWVPWGEEEFQPPVPQQVGAGTSA
jgi:hypothetical protein